MNYITIGTHQGTPGELGEIRGKREENLICLPLFPVFDKWAFIWYI